MAQDHALSSSGIDQQSGHSAEPAPPLLRIDQIEVAYHRVVTALQGVSVDVPQGSIVAILGTNGAGKTTTLRAVSGFIGLDDARVTSGRILFEGDAIENQSPHRITARGIALVPERDKVFPNLTVSENLEATVSRPGTDRRALMLAVWELFPALVRLRQRTAGLLSGGERQMLAIGSALLCGPKLLLVDELSQGLAPRVVDDIAEQLLTIRDRLGISVLLVEQNAELALGMADHGYIMENGRIVIDGSPQALRDHADVQEFYLGGSGTRRSYRDVKQYRRSRRWFG